MGYAYERESDPLQHFRGDAHAYFASSNSPRSRQRWVRHQVLSQESASMSLSPLGSRAALVSELVDIHVRNRG